MHRGKNLLVSLEAAALLDPICRAETERMRAADGDWRRLLDHLAAVGPSSVEDLRTELRLKRQELKALRSPLERCGVIVSRSMEVTGGAGEERSSVLARWDQAYPAGGGTAADPGRALGDSSPRPCVPPSWRPRRSRGAGSPGVVLDRHAYRRPRPRGTAAPGGRSPDGGVMRHGSGCASPAGGRST